MLLVIDAGNTKRSRDEYAAWLIPLLGRENLDFKDISDVVISSVVPDINHHMRGLCRHYICREPKFVSYEMVSKLGLKVNVASPADVGADRLVNAVAIHFEYRYPAIVIDFGTATTFDVIDSSGAFIGGAITPGINLSVNALHQAAAMLPRISVRKPDSVICGNTIQAMQSGIFWGYVGLIEGMVRRMEEEIGEKPFVIATGGLAPVFSESVEAIEAIDRDITIKGLYHIHQKTAK